MDKAVKLAIIVGILLAGFGVFYHYVIYLPSLEQRKVESEREEKEAAKRAEVERVEAAKRAESERLEFALRLEEERAEAARRAQIAKLEAAQRDLRRDFMRKSAYNDCLDRAGKAYDVNWADACKANAKARSASLKNCLEDPNVMNYPNMGARWCHSTWGAADPSPSCSLPSSVAESINKTHDKAKQQCLAEAKLF